MNAEQPFCSSKLLFLENENVFQAVRSKVKTRSFRQSKSRAGKKKTLNPFRLLRDVAPRKEAKVSAIGGSSTAPVLAHYDHPCAPHRIISASSLCLLARSRIPRLTMPGRILPNIPVADVAARSSAKSCYVTLGTKVYDITSFLDDHPGGADLILEYGGQDVADVMGDEVSHLHSSAAYEILDEHLIGFVATEKVVDVAAKSAHPQDIVPLPPTRAGEKELQANGVPDPPPSSFFPPAPLYANTGLSSAADLSRDTDTSLDLKTHKFLDLNRPLFMQVWRGGFSKAFYLEQVHRPRHYRGGASAPLFGNFLEPLSKTPWWVVPLVWLPPVAYGTALAYGSLRGGATETAAYWMTGLAIWTLVEYLLHRFLFHIEQALPDNRVGITAHFLLHGIHHYLPMDKYRLVMPPTLFVVLATPFWKLAHTLFFYNWYAATAVYCGGIFGYVSYDLTHYFLHHRK